MSNIKTIYLDKMKIAYLLCFSFLIQSQDKFWTIYNFNDAPNASQWKIVDDRVMGGVSQGKFSLNEDGLGLYQGKVSLDNNGGFSSLRLRLEEIDVSKYNAVVLRVKGDKKKYQFRIKANSRDYYSYTSNFKTSGEWEEIVIPLNKFIPQFRGRQLNMPNFDKAYIEEIAFLIGNKVEESFQIEIENIVLINIEN